MNKLPTWWNAEITIFNKYEDTDGIITWYKTSINNCFWKNTFTKAKVNQVEIDTDTVTCRIPSTCKFIDKISWNELDDKSSKFTLASGDIIILGKVDDVINEYEKGKRSSDLVSKYSPKGCMIISNVSIDTWSGSSLSHYYVVGV